MLELPLGAELGSCCSQFNSAPPWPPRRSLAFQRPPIEQCCHMSLGCAPQPPHCSSRYLLSDYCLYSLFFPTKGCHSNHLLRVFLAPKCWRSFRFPFKTYPPKNTKNQVDTPGVLVSSDGPPCGRQRALVSAHDLAAFLHLSSRFVDTLPHLRSSGFEATKVNIFCASH